MQNFQNFDSKSQSVIVKDLYAKIEWLLMQHGKALGPTFIDMAVCQYLTSRKMSRYFIRRMLTHLKCNQKLIMPKLEQSASQLDVIKTRAFQRKRIHSHRTNNSLFIFAYLHHKLAQANLPSKGNKVELFRPFFTRPAVNYAPRMLINLKETKDEDSNPFLSKSRTSQLKNFNRDVHIYRQHTNNNVEALSSRDGRKRQNQYERKRNTNRVYKKRVRQLNIQTNNQDVLDRIMNLPTQLNVDNPQIYEFYNGFLFN